MFMRVRFLMLVCAAAVTVAEARAADLSAVFPYQQSPLPYGDLREEEPAAFWELFNVAFDHRVWSNNSSVAFWCCHSAFVLICSCY
jgi:hypothetical protein